MSEAWTRSQKSASAVDPLSGWDRFQARPMGTVLETMVKRQVMINVRAR